MRKIRNIPGEEIPNRFDDDLNKMDSDLFESVGDYMKGRSDIEDVLNDPALAEIRESVNGMVEHYHRNKFKNSENESFIKGVFSKDAEDVNNTNEEIISIRTDIENNNLNEITAEWVKEWHEKKQKSVVADQKASEIAGFITSSLNTEIPVSSSGEKIKSSSKTKILKYISLAAAAIVAALFIINTLLPASDPGKIFNEYYKPFEAMSVVTRDIKTNNDDRFSSAIADYKKGDYINASAEFKALLENDPKLESSGFFLGLSQLGMGNYKQAIVLLSDISDRAGEYGKEARWYTGLAYLKIADKTKALEYFESLSRTEGFYRERSEKILRRLK